MHKKKYIASKICVVCKRSFNWRKKWEKDWKEVKYCSKKCRINKKTKFKKMIS